MVLVLPSSIRRRPSIKIEIRQEHDIVPNNKPMPSNVFFVKFCTWTRTLNHDEEFTVDYNLSSLVREETFLVQRDSILCDFNDAKLHICPWLLSMNIPSELHLFVAKKFHIFAVSMVNDPENIDREILPVLMNFTTIWFRPNIEYQYSIEDPNPMERAIPASEASIDKLEKVKLKGLDFQAECVICCEEFSTEAEAEAEVTRMPCFHVYHENCIVRWLKKSHLCPLCRFEMPTM